MVIKGWKTMKSGAGQVIQDLYETDRFSTTSVLGSILLMVTGSLRKHWGNPGTLPFRNLYSSTQTRVNQERQRNITDWGPWRFETCHRSALYV